MELLKKVGRYLKNNWSLIVFGFIIWFGVNSFLFYVFLVKFDFQFYDCKVRGFVQGATAVFVFLQILEGDE